MSDQQKPSVGRVIHYVSWGSPIQPDGSQRFKPQCRAAIITEVSEQPDETYLIGLAAINPTGLFFHSLADGGVMADFTENQGGTWHYPERV